MSKSYDEMTEQSWSWSTMLTESTTIYSTDDYGNLPVLLTTTHALPDHVSNLIAAAPDLASAAEFVEQWLWKYINGQRDIPLHIAESMHTLLSGVVKKAKGVKS